MTTLIMTNTDPPKRASVSAFSPGMRVETRSGLTKGEVQHVSEDGALDIQGDHGFRYRNCLPDMWRQEKQAPHATYRPWQRGDTCHIIYEIAGDYLARNGWVISARELTLFIMFDDLDSASVMREFVVRGHGEHAL